MCWLDLPATVDLALEFAEESLVVVVSPTMSGQSALAFAVAFLTMQEEFIARRVAL